MREKVRPPSVWFARTGSRNTGKWTCRDSARERAELTHGQREPGEVRLALATQRAQERREAALRPAAVAEVALDGLGGAASTGRGGEHAGGELAAHFRSVLPDGLQRPALHPGRGGN